MRTHTRSQFGISTIASVVIVVIVLVVALLIGASFLMSNKLGGAGLASTSLLSTSTTSSFSSSLSTTSTVVSTTSSPTALTTTSSTTSHYTSYTTSSTSIQGTVNYSPSCFPLYTQGGVHVFGILSPETSGNVKSVNLYWSYHGQKGWTWLNDLTYGPSFSNDGNFSHRWNPPEAAYYDFLANWTLSSGQVITGITSQPFQVVAQGSSCP